jgi:hypothetical protein
MFKQKTHFNIMCNISGHKNKSCITTITTTMTCIFFWHQINEKKREETRMTQRRKEKRRKKETKFSGGCGGQCPPRQAPPISRSARRKLSAFTTGWSCMLLLHITCQNVEDEASLDEAK